MLRKGLNSLLISVLAFCPSAFCGNVGDGNASERKALPSPVGAIESIGAIRIDGRLAHSGAVLWGNELLEAPAIESAQLTLKETGLITLSGGSSLKLVSVPKEGEAIPTLFAQLVAGSMTIKLNGRAGARICASDSIFAVSPGSSARLLISEGHGRLLSSNGEVKEDSDWRLFQVAPVALQADAQLTPGEYKIAPYNFTFGLGGYADIEARSVRYLQFRVTDKDDKPAPDMLLLILLKKIDGSPGAGSINYGAAMMRVTTDQNGVATARFDAGVTIGAHSAIEVTIVKTNQTLKGNIRIVKAQGFWTLKNAAPLMTTVAASVAVAAIAGRTDGGDLPAITPAPVEEEPDCFIHHHSPGPKECSESPYDRRRRPDYPERPPSGKRENHRKFHGAPGRSWPNSPEPKSKRGGHRMFRGNFGITFSVKR